MIERGKLFSSSFLIFFYEVEIFRAGSRSSPAADSCLVMIIILYAWYRRSHDLPPWHDDNSRFGAGRERWSKLERIGSYPTTCTFLLKVCRNGFFHNRYCKTRTGTLRLLLSNILPDGAESKYPRSLPTIRCRGSAARVTLRYWHSKFSDPFQMFWLSKNHYGR